MVINSFTCSRLPQLYFGCGSLAMVPKLVHTDKVLLITGSRSFENSPHFPKLVAAIKNSGIHIHQEHIPGEPSPEMIDVIAGRYRKQNNITVLAIGGGSVMDAGKAIAAMIPVEAPVIDFLEGVGTREHIGTRVPLITAPTTAGTGSEATKNAVLSRTGIDGFKKSLRHDNFVPDFALIDPELAFSCPPEITAYSGMDALSQLVEAYTSSKANPFTDSLAIEAIALVLAALPTVLEEPENADARSKLAYGAYISGIALAQAGLGVVHGIAGPLGGFFSAPHGALCGTLLPAVMRITLEGLEKKEDLDTLKKFAAIGNIVTGDSSLSPQKSAWAFLEQLEMLQDLLSMPGLASFGINEENALAASKACDSKNARYVFSEKEILSAILLRI